MVIDALRGYLQIASGLTEVPRERARSAARAVLAQAGALGEESGATPAQVRRLGDELAKAARDNRDLLLGLVRAEVERAVASAGMASADDVAALSRQVEVVSRRVDRLARPATGAQPASPAPATMRKRASSSAGPTRKTAASRAPAAGATTPTTSGPTTAVKTAPATATAGKAAGGNRTQSKAATTKTTRTTASQRKGSPR